MRKAVKTMWVNALRSGKYQQGQRRLKDGDTYCCLGVLCDLYQRSTGHGTWHNYDAFLDKGTEFRAYLPLTVAKWAGLKFSTSHFSGLSIRANSWNSSEELATLNDNGKSFEEIAKVIETSVLVAE